MRGAKEGSIVLYNIIIWSILGAAILVAAPATIADAVLMFKQVLGEEGHED